MDVIVLDPKEQARLISHRRDARSDHHDEVWDGDYVLTPLPNNEHQEILWNLTLGFLNLTKTTGRGEARPGANVTDQIDDWERNYRCCDVVYYTHDTKAQIQSDHSFGGPDFIVEIITLHDRTRKKVDFYAHVAVRKLLIVDRYPWALELYRLSEPGTLDLVGRSTLDQPEILTSEVVPLTFQLQPGDQRPTILVEHTEGDHRWSA